MDFSIPAKQYMQHVNLQNADVKKNVKRDIPPLMQINNTYSLTNILFVI